MTKESLREPHIAIFLIRDKRKIKAQPDATAEAERELLWRITQEGTARPGARDEPNALMRVKLIDAKAAISAIAELNRMDSNHAAQKDEANATAPQAERMRALKGKHHV